MNIPRLFLYLDFYAPLFYTLFFIFLIFLRLKFLFKELIYKFLVDYLAKNSIYKMKNLKFIDLLLNNFISKGFSINSIGRIYFNLYLKNKYYNNIIILIIILFLIIWGFILI